MAVVEDRRWLTFGEERKNAVLDTPNPLLKVGGIDARSPTFCATEGNKCRYFVAKADRKLLLDARALASCSLLVGGFRGNDEKATERLIHLVVFVLMTDADFFFY